jgi:hypothetical protein
MAEDDDLFLAMELAGTLLNIGLVLATAASDTRYDQDTGQHR